MEQIIIASYYDSYERTEVHLIVTKRLKELPQYGEKVTLKGKEYEIVKADYDYEVSQASSVLLYDVVVAEI